MSKLILLVDDDPITHTIVKGVLEQDMVLDGYFNLKEAEVGIAEGETPALAIIDRMLPDGDGLELCSKMRAEDRLCNVPIIFLSSKNSETDKVGGLFAGADDYISKPVSPLELKARILARLRATSKKLNVGKLVIDLSSQRVSLVSEEHVSELELTRIEFKLLVTFAQSPDRVFTRDALLNHVWGLSANITDRVVDTHLSHLRKKIASAGLKIQSLRGEGYRLVEDKSSLPQVA